MSTDRPGVPEMLAYLTQAYETLQMGATEDERARLLSVLSDFRWYSQRLGADRWAVSPRSDKWSFAEILWHVTRQAVQASGLDEHEPVVYFIDHGKEHVGQTAELWFLLES